MQGETAVTKGGLHDLRESEKRVFLSFFSGKKSFYSEKTPLKSHKREKKTDITEFNE